jgi:hypothetical protein
MDSNNQQQEILTCECCKEIIKPTIFEQKCTNCAIAALSDDIAGGNDNDYMPNLENLSIDDILSQDDPPKELYLCDDEVVDEEEIPDDVDKDTAWMIWYNDNADAEDFDIYEHFGIPDDIDSDEADALLEAAIPDRG